MNKSWPVFLIALLIVLLIAGDAEGNDRVPEGCTTVQTYEGDQWTLTEQGWINESGNPVVIAETGEGLTCVPERSPVPETSSPQPSPERSTPTPEPTTAPTEAKPASPSSGASPAPDPSPQPRSSESSKTSASEGDVVTETFVEEDGVPVTRTYHNWNGGNAHLPQSGL